MILFDFNTKWRHGVSFLAKQTNVHKYLFQCLHNFATLHPPLNQGERPTK